ncbi:hypothetical protein [Pedobacter endophyticus]|uniref:DUF541 domain-containing protein n=1 Tax=Pedobacter endophyticus TaxID=2789740 RepID=A0A7S9PZB7_9SPHI|nr:hypothetical protein [Pedobacter endophyticus]QPH40193.1 hypothetical protein IZT61_02620 [Pedobacter endophyticus]
MTMKINYLSALFYATSLIFMSTTVVAQVTERQPVSEEYVQMEGIDGDKIIKDLANNRYLYNKSLISHTKQPLELPKPQSIIDAQATINFGGYDYVIVNKKVTQVKGLVLSTATLALLSDKLNLLDRFQHRCADRVNAEYAQPNRNLQYIKTLDRQYFSALNQFTEITQHIAQLSKKRNASITIELALRKIEGPSNDVFLANNRQVMVAEVAQK